MTQTLPTCITSSSLAFPTTFTTLTFPPHAGTITALAWSEDNTHLAAVSSAGLLIIWHANSGACLLSQQITRAPLSAVAWSQHGRSLLLGSKHGSLCVFHLASRTLVHSTTFPHPVAQIALSPSAVEARFLVRTGPSLYLFTQGQAEPRILRYSTPLVDACWAPDGQSLALVCANGLVEVCDTRSRRVRWQRTETPSQALRVTWDATGSRLAVGMTNGMVQMHSLSSGQENAPLPLSRFPIQALGWGEHYLVAGSEREVAFWNDTEAATHHQPTEAVPALAFDFDGAVLATAWPQQIALTALV